MLCNGSSSNFLGQLFHNPMYFKIRKVFTATVFALVCISVKWLLILFLSLSAFAPSKFLQATNEAKLLIFFYYSRSNGCFLYSSLHFLQFICVPFAEWDLIFHGLEVIYLPLLPEVIIWARADKSYIGHFVEVFALQTTLTCSAFSLLHVFRS